MQTRGTTSEQTKVLWELGEGSSQLCPEVGPPCSWWSRDSPGLCLLLSIVINGAPFMISKVSPFGQ